MLKYKELRRLSSASTGSVFIEDIDDDDDSSQVNINVGGTIFSLRKTLLSRIPGSVLALLEKGSPEFNQSKNEFYFERDPKLFKHILNVYREGELHIPRSVCPLRFRKEMAFWEVPNQLLAACCWKDFYSVDEELNILNILVESTLNSKTNKDCAQLKNKSKLETGCEKDQCWVPEKKTGEKKESIQQRVWLFLDDPKSSTAAKVWFFFYIFLVIVSAVIVMIWNEPSVRVDPYINDYFFKLAAQFYEWAGEQNLTMEAMPFTEKAVRFISTDPHPLIYTINSACNLIFIIECMLHFAVCPQKKKLMRSVYHWFKFGLTLAIVASTFLDVRRDLLNSEDKLHIFVVFRGFNVLRLLLIFRLRKFYKGFQLMLLSLTHSAKEAALLLLAFSICIVIYGGMFYCAEINSDMFDNTIHSMWWALITMTTVGYGDIYPTHNFGYLVGALCAINGLIVIAIPVAAIAQNFTNIYGRNADLEKYLQDINDSKKKDHTNPASENNKQ